jgi:tetratricopeptide (TPR) repeat protein
MKALHEDARGTPVSCADTATLALYEQALLQYQSYVGDPIATIDQALAARPDFVLGHLFRAGVLMTFGEQRFVPTARDSLRAAEALAERPGERELVLTHAMRQLVEGDWHGGCAMLDRVLVDHPTDAFAIQTAHLFDFYRGDALNLRNRVTRVLPHWSADQPGYSYILGMHAFGLEECNQYAQAEDAAQRALAIEPRDGWAVHAAVHCMEMQNRTDEGIAFLTEREQDWAPDNGFAFHNWWHLALFHLDRGDDARVLALYDTRIYPQEADAALTLVDATALLWRLHLLDVDVGSRMAVLARMWEAKLDAEAEFYAFNDVHALMAFAITGKQEAMARALASAAGAFGADVGEPIGRGLAAFGQGDYARTVHCLLPVRDLAHRFGGSHAQRDLITLTLIDAARRSGQPALARHYLAERQVLRPASGLGRRLLARIG